MSTVRRLLGPGRYILAYPEPEGVRLEVWEGTAQVTESRLGGITVSADHVDEAVARLIEVLRKLG